MTTSISDTLQRLTNSADFKLGIELSTATETVARARLADRPDLLDIWLRTEEIYTSLRKKWAAEDAIYGRIAHLRKTRTVRTFVPPANFEEFLERYPARLSDYLRRKWYVAGIDLEDTLQDVYAFLLYIPQVSKLRDRGCIDRIGAYDPTKQRGELNEHQFFGYLFGIVDRHLMNVKKHSRMRTISRCVSIDSPPIGYEECDSEQYLALLAPPAPPDLDAHLIFEQTQKIAESIHPLLAKARLLRSEFKSDSAVAAELGITPWRMHRIKPYLQALERRDWATLDKFTWEPRQHKPYKTPSRKNKKVISHAE